MKNLYVEMFDAWGSYNDFMLNGSGRGYSRIVKVALTPEQEALLEPRYVGKSGHDKIYETVKPISIQEEE